MGDTMLLRVWHVLSSLSCHCEAQSAEAISRNARGLPRLRLAMTLEEEGCVTNVLDEYNFLTGWFRLTKMGWCGKRYYRCGYNKEDDAMWLM